MGVISLILAYLLGSISTSYIVGKVARGVDIRNFGSGNAGATNTLRVLGWKMAVIVLLGDIVKGILAIAFASMVTSGSPAYVSHIYMALAGLLAILGHNWPAFFQFRGGKGVATTIGVLAVLSFMPALYAGLLAIVVILLTRYVSLGSLVFITFTFIFQFFMHIPATYIWVTLIIGILVYWRHRENIDRLLHGKENRIFSR